MICQLELTEDLKSRSYFQPWKNQRYFHLCQQLYPCMQPFQWYSLAAPGLHYSLGHLEKNPSCPELAASFLIPPWWHSFVLLDLSPGACGLSEVAAPIGKDYEMLHCELVAGVRSILEHTENWNWLDDIWMARLVGNEIGEEAPFSAVSALTARGMPNLTIFLFKFLLSANLSSVCQSPIHNTQSLVY